MKVNAIKKLFDDKWINVYTANYTHNGVTSEWAFASRQKEVDKFPCNTGDAVVVFASYKKWFFSRTRYAITKEFRIPIRDYEYSFPAGLIDEGEMPESAAIRELREETGLIVSKVNKVSPPIFSSAGFCDEAVYMVFVECNEQVKPKLGDDEDIKTYLLTKKEIKEMFKYDHIKWGCRPWCLLKAWLEGV